MEMARVDHPGSVERQRVCRLALAFFALRSFKIAELIILNSLVELAIQKYPRQKVELGLRLPRHQQSFQGGR